MALPSSFERMVQLVTKAYCMFLSLYPLAFRSRFAQEMQDHFKERCLEAYQIAGITGIGRWLLMILTGEAVSLYREYVNMMVDLFEKDRDARRALGLGMFFLAGTWMALFFTAASAAGGRMACFILVLTNALLVARSFLHSERMEYIAGMAAMTNIFLVAGLMAVQSSLGLLPVLSYAMQIVLVGLHGLLLWQLRGEDFTQQRLKIEKGE